MTYTIKLNLRTKKLSSAKHTSSLAFSAHISPEPYPETNRNPQSFVSSWTSVLPGPDYLILGD